MASFINGAAIRLTDSLREYHNESPMIITTPVNFPPGPMWIFVWNTYSAAISTNRSIPTYPISRKAVCWRMGYFSTNFRLIDANNHNASKPRQTPRTTTRMSELMATAVTTLSTLKLKSINWMANTVGQNVRGLVGKVSGSSSCSAA